MIKEYLHRVSQRRHGEPQRNHPARHSRAPLHGRGIMDGGRLGEPSLPGHGWSRVRTILCILYATICHITFAETPELWLYLHTNFLVDKNVEDSIALIRRAKEAGYTTVLAGDSKFCRWDDMWDKYFKNVSRFREEARALGLECWAMVAPIGYSNDLLSCDPDLAEGLPVSNAVFVVKDGKFVPEGEGMNILQNGSFDEVDDKAFYERGRLQWWSFVDEPGKISFLDEEVKADGRVSLRMERSDRSGDLSYKNARVSQKLKLAPFSYWHVSAMVKTENFEALDEINFLALGETGQALNHQTPPIKRTQDWTRVDAVFNTLDNENVTLYLGVWGIRGGKIWWDDVRVEPAGFVNAIGIDPVMGRVPYGGCYDAWHAAPEVKAPEGAGEGEKVTMTYHHSTIIYNGQVGICIAAPKTRELLKWQIEKVREHFQPDGYMLSHDEMRQCGWDAACLATGKTPGEMLAENVRYCIDTVRAVDPGKPAAVWSDMFDPHHNAKADGYYYLVRGKGPWSGSWEGLDSATTIVNWNSGEKGMRDSIRHFEKMGNAQVLAGYYDSPDLGWINKWIAAYEEETGKTPKAVMYTTWRGDFNKLEEFAKTVNGKR